MIALDVMSGIFAAMSLSCAVYAVWNARQARAARRKAEHYRWEAEQHLKRIKANGRP